MRLVVTLDDQDVLQLDELKWAKRTTRLGLIRGAVKAYLAVQTRENVLPDTRNAPVMAKHSWEGFPEDEFGGDEFYKLLDGRNLPSSFWSMDYFEQIAWLDAERPLR